MCKSNPTRRVFLLITSIVALGFWLNIPQPSLAHSKAVTYHNPLVYVGVDGNYYVTSLGGITTTAITSDMVVEPNEYDSGVIPNHYGSWPHWSPQGAQFAFVNNNALYVVASGQKPQQVVSVPNEKLANGAFAWSPDGKHIVYVRGVDYGAPFARDALQIIQPNGTLVRKSTLSDGRTEGGGGCGSGSGPGPERAKRMLGEERDQEIFLRLDTINLNWTSQGFLFSFGCFPFQTFLNAETGSLIRKSVYLDNMIVSPDNTRVLANTYAEGDSGLAGYDNTSRPILIDLATGDELPLPLAVGAKPLAWTPDGKSVIFATQTLYQKIEPTGNGSSLSDSQEHYDFTLKLWRQGLNDKQPTKLFEHRGYAFGWVMVSPDSASVVFSLISNTFFDKVNPEVQIVAVPMNGGQAQWIAVGGKPAFGKGSFTAIPTAPKSELQFPKCPKSLVSRLKIGQRAKVTPGEPNSLRSLPAGGTGLRIMYAGSVSLVLDGPKCGSDGLAWWKVNYQGVVGWTAESDSKSYWLEQ